MDLGKSVNWRTEVPLRPLRHPNELQYETERARRYLTSKMVEFGKESGPVPDSENSEPTIEHFAFAACLRICVKSDPTKADAFNRNPEKLVGDLFFIPMPEGVSHCWERMNKLEAKIAEQEKEIERLKQELGEAWANALQQGDEAF